MWCEGNEEDCLNTNCRFDQTIDSWIGHSCLWFLQLITSLLSETIMFCNSTETMIQCIHKFTCKDYSALKVQAEISSKAWHPKLLCCSFILPIGWGQATLIERCDELTQLLYEQVKRRSRTYCRTRVMSRCSHRRVCWQKWSFNYTTVHVRMAYCTVTTHLTTCACVCF